ncbi:MAG: Flp pilus assembly complex ATPase component TadA, partial [Parcubacteria group bacterium]|nr:Flp pilus assembly complex ATPase component TadA [Parcubacteria group bacterium]
MDDPAQSLPREEALARIREEEEEDVVKIRASKLGLSYIDLESVPLEVEALRLIPEQSARQAGLLVFAKRPKEFSVAMLDPGRPDTKALLKELEKFGHLNLFLASERSFNKYIGGYQFVPHERAELTGKLTISPQTFEASLKLPHSFTAVGTVVKGIPTTETGQLIQHVFATALTLEASDIHIEPEETQTALRYRIDGVLHRIADLASETGKRLGDRVKLLAELKLNVQDSPQDGRFSVVLPNEKIDIRVSTVPGPYGENVVMRLLFEKAIAVRLEDLGLRDDDTEILNRELKRPNGLIVVTGPTGSGKTTTLYACLRKIASPDIKVITLE